jgi:hypothetical protein
LKVRVSDQNYLPLDNAEVICSVTTPDQKKMDLPAAASGDKAGTYLTEVVPRLPGGYRVVVTAKSADGSEVGTCATGFTHEPATEEYQVLRPNRELLQRLAQRTAGELLEPGRLDSFVASLPNRKMPVTEPWVYPLWHQWPMLCLAIFCLVGEWGIRRWKGLP